MVHLDFETYSEVDITRCGAFRYAKDPSTDVLIMCHAVDAGPVQRWTCMTDDPVLGCPPELTARITAGDLFVAHNAQFEYVIWKYVLHERYGWPMIPLEQWHCTAAHAATLKLPRSLGNAGAAARVPIQKDKEGVRLIKLFCMPRKPTKKKPQRRILPEDEPSEFERFVQYCEIDVQSERALGHKLPPMNKREVHVWRYDTRINERGLPIDTALVRRTMRIVDELQRDIIAETRTLTCTADNPEGIAPTQVSKLLGFINDDKGDDTPAIANMQRKEIEERTKLTKYPERVDRLLQLRLEAARVSTKKLISMLAVCGDDQRARGTLLYHGAGPGRWSGKLIQPHNFVRGTYKQEQRDIVVSILERYDAEALRLLFPRPMEAVSNVMRAFITAPPGRVLYVADYASIEARILVWLAGQERMVQMYHEGADLYIWMAAQIFNIPESAVDSEQRRLGKQVILGAGYGMGEPKFIDTCWNVGNFVCPPSIAHLGITTYRETHDRVKALWYEMERAAVRCVQTWETTYAASGRIRFRMWRSAEDPDFQMLFMRLPSGREVAYPYPTVYQGKYGPQVSYLTENPVTRQWGWTEGMYGGKWAENAVQAIARDIMLNGMVQAEKAEYEVVSTVHDEIISERDEGTGDLHEYESLVCALPAWAQGCPIKAEGFVAKRWRKA